MTNKQNILHLISQSDTAMSHNELLASLEGSMNRVTIYRILDKLTTEGMIHKVIDINGVSKFASCNDCDKHDHHHNHVHFSCTSCDSVTCLEDVIPAFTLPKNYQVKEANFTLSGICPDCAN